MLQLHGFELAERENVDQQFRQLTRKWSVKVKELIRVQRQEDVKEDLEYLAMTLENLNI